METALKQKSCVICGSPAPKKRYDCCSRECGFKLMRHRASERSQQRVFGQFCSVSFSQCECGNVFRDKGKKEFCSSDCQYRYRQLKTPQRTRELCAECGAVFFYGDGCRKRKYCSTQCGEKVFRRKRKLKERYGLERSDALSFRKVFDSTGGRCYICGHLCYLTHHVPHPLAPTIDHKHPLSLGGSNTMDNAGIAHFICNTLKSNKLNPNDYVDRCSAAVQVALSQRGNPWEAAKAAR